MTADEKQKLIDRVFKKMAKVKVKDLENAFKPDEAKFVYAQSQTPVTDKDIPSLSSFCFFAKDTVLGQEYVESEEGRETVEKIILDLTVFNERLIMTKRLERYNLPFGRNDKKQVINAIKNKPMAGWGKLSRKLLTLKTPYPVNEYGEIVQKTLIQLMKETNFAFMRLINDESLDFKRQIDEANEAAFEEFGDRKLKHKAVVEFVDDAYVSPGMKRPLIQAMNIIDDVEKILRHPIDEYYVECTRSNKAEKKKKASRKEQLETLYETALKMARKDKEDENVNRIRNAQAVLKSMEEGKLRSDKYFLYFLQLGHDMYSLKPIDLSNIDNYDIDHIIPQALVKDDSLSNRVLVASEENREKGAQYPIKDEVFKGSSRKDAKKFYGHLKSMGLMSDKKYASLTRTSPLTEDDLQSFVNRQLVYTSQSVKALTDLIKKFQRKEDGTVPLIVYSKAENVSDFRHKFDILKSRDANDCHHAHDAYLNICVGRAFHRYFELTYWKNRNEPVSELLANIAKGKESLNFENVFESYQDKNGVVHRKPLLDKDGGLVWDYESSVGAIKNNVYRRYYMFMTKMQCTSGNFFAKNILAPKGEGNTPIKLKVIENVDGVITERESPFKDLDKYGGKPSLSYGFYALVEIFDKKKGKQELIAPVPNLYCKPGDAEALVRYLEDEKKLNVQRVLITCLRPNFVIKKNQSKIMITGVGDALKTYWVKPIIPLYYSEREISTIRVIHKFVDLVSKKAKKDEEEAFITKGGYSAYADDGLVLSPAANSHVKGVKLLNSDLTNLFDKFANLDNPCFELCEGFARVSNALKAGKAHFETLSMYQRSKMLIDLASYFNASSQTVNLSVLPNGDKSAGALRLSATLSTGCAIVAESPTGFYEKVLWKSE